MALLSCADGGCAWSPQLVLQSRYTEQVHRKQVKVLPQMKLYLLTLYMCLGNKLPFKRNYKCHFWLLNSFLATVRPSAWRGVCAVMKGILKYTLLINIFCLENPHTSHNAVNGSTAWTETFLNAEDATLDTAPPTPLPPINTCSKCTLRHSRSQTQIGSTHLLGNMLRELPWVHPKYQTGLWAERNRLLQSSSRRLHHAASQFSAYTAPFCAMRVWKK